MLFCRWMKRTLAAASIALAFAGTAIAADVIAVIDGVSSGVRAKGTINAASIAARAASAAGADGYEVLEGLSSISDSGVFAVFKSESLDRDELTDRLERDENITCSRGGKIRALGAPNDALFSQQWGAQTIGLPDAWDVVTDASDIYVAIIDTGINTSPMHEDLDGNIAAEYGATFINGRKSSDFHDGNGHGTNVAGVIGAIGNNAKGVAGVCWKVKMIPIKILGDDGSGDSDDEIYALDHIAKLIKDEGIRVAAINLSLGGYQSLTPGQMKGTPVWRAYDAFSKLPYPPIFAVAAGNEGAEVGAPLTGDVRDGGTLVGRKGEYTYPASLIGIDGLIVVSATNDKNAAPSFTNWGSAFVQLCAPGSAIMTADKNGGYIFKNGTSFAAPHVAGAAALIAKHHNVSATEIKRRLLLTADEGIDPTTTSGSENQVALDRKISAYGMLRADRALAATEEELAQKEKDAPQPTFAKVISYEGNGYAQGTKMKVGLGELKLVCSVSPPTAQVDVSWESSDTSVATVDEKSGEVTAKKEGTATITATATKKNIASSGVHAAPSSVPAQIEVEVVDILPNETTHVQPSGSGGGGGCAAFGALALPFAALIFIRARRFLL